MNQNTAAWGKLSPPMPPDMQPVRLPLAHHCIDVAMVFLSLCAVPGIQARWRQINNEADLSDGQIARLAVLAFLHDLGKCNRGFQAKADPRAKDTAGHVMEAVALLCELQNCWPPAWRALIEEIAGWFADEAQAMQMLLASISHHGHPVSERDYEAWLVNPANYRHARHWEAANGYDPMSALDELAQTVRHAFPAAFSSDVPKINATPTLQQRFAGLVMLADWIGSDTQFFPFRQSLDEDRASFARKAAQRALQTIGLIPPQTRTPKPFAEVFSFAPSPLQQALAETIDATEENRLLLVESDTGSGKTEAALAWYFRLYAEGQVDGLYFALPTRVAAREIYGRVHKAVATAFEPTQRPGPVLLAAPGYVKVDGEDVPPMLPDPQGTLWDDSKDDHTRERFWSAERPKRFLAAPVAVGTIDQALLSVLQVKHSLLRSVCLDRHLLVVDEVHASDPYMREVLKVLLQGHVARGGWALLLSATLGEAAACEYFGRPCAPLEEAVKRRYPLITTCSQTHPMPAARERRIAVELSPTLTDDDALMPRIIEALAQGARVLVVCNTVARANALFRKAEAAIQRQAPCLLSALFALNGVRCPHHGRFTREDRELLDAAVTAQFGKGSPAGAKLLIGTQTLEQSLDIDADWLVTDLAPMDVLIQRFGRLHRHKRTHRPPGFETPHVTVRVPGKDLSEYLGKGHELRAPAGLGTVYPDGRVLAATWMQLKQHPTITLPQQARFLIEHTTHPEALKDLPEVWRKHGQIWIGKQQGQVVQALRSVLDDKPFGELHYPDKGEQVLTRLGAPTLDIPLAEPLPSAFGITIHRIPVPAHWLEGEPVPEVLHAERTDTGFRFAIGITAFRYTRFGLEKDDV